MASEAAPSSGHNCSAAGSGNRVEVHTTCMPTLRMVTCEKGFCLGAAFLT